MRMTRRLGKLRRHRSLGNTFPFVFFCSVPFGPEPRITVHEQNAFRRQIKERN